MTRRRILYLCFERIVPGSAAATHVGEICAGLRRRGLDVRLLAEEGVRGGGLKAQLARYAKLTLAAVTALPGRDIVYMRAHFAGVVVSLLARLARRRIVQEVNGLHSEAFVTHPRLRPLQGLLTALQRRQYRWADALIAVTPELTAWAAGEAGHGRAHHVPNGANTDVFSPDGPIAERARPYALFFGGLARWHGVEVMLDAVRSPDWPTGVELVIAGPIVDPSLGPATESLPPGVTWLGPLPQREIAALIRGAVACLVPSVDPRGITAQGITPLKLFEAMAGGAPVVVSDFRGMADIVREGGCGIVVPTANPAALARAVATLAADPERARRLGEAGAALVRERYSWDASAARTAAIIEALTTSR